MITYKNNYDQIVTLPEEKFQFRPSVYGVIKNGNKICISYNKSNNKIWLPGGGVSVGEKLQNALLREIKEETGLTNIKIKKLLGVFEIFTTINQPTKQCMHFYSFMNAQLIKKNYFPMKRLMTTKQVIFNG